MNRLIHYTNKELSLEPRTYNQFDMTWQAKPNGLWFSVEGHQDWKSWCEDEKFKLENLAISYEIILKDDANILHLKTPDEIRAFGKTYQHSTRYSDIDDDSSEINWDRVKEKHQGIIISPYQWDCRLALDTCWYYGWDCASGCIWDLSCIEEFKLIENELAHVPK